MYICISICTYHGYYTVRGPGRYIRHPGILFTFISQETSFLLNFHGIFHNFIFLQKKEGVRQKTEQYYKK